MKNWIAAAIGGAIGSIGRYGVMVIITQYVSHVFPWGTLAVNTIGSFVLGLLIELLAVSWSLPEVYRVFLVVGVLGSFTTYSTFSLDIVTLMSRGVWWQTIGYVLLSLAAGIIALLLGLRFGRWLWVVF